MPYSDADLIEDIRAVAAEVGEKPTLNDYREHGTAAVTTIYDRFGSWQDALDAAGYEPREPDSAVTDEELLEELDRVADDLGERPTATDMNDHGAYWASTYRRAFGSWNNALEAAGIDSSPSQDRQPVSDEALLEELERVAERVDGTPTTRAMEERGEHSPNTYIRRFGSWNDAVTAAGFEPNTEVGTETVTTEALIDELHRLADEIGDRPVAADLREHGEHALRTYQQRFGSWSAALAAAFDDEPTEDA
ncbi:homing endonuclease associated repeat-containing protein [Halobaculum rarum]|uniref:homing endonuclease associated repeat-containing protein n=1 Tax=Halobaculum rarum TaxID=3075122 RepID=UPI0032AEE0BF